MKDQNPGGLYVEFLKPALDFLIALVLLILLWPLFVLLWFLLFAANGGKVFFIQDRIGKNRKVFRIIKFKTMNDRRDASGNLLPDAQRQTAFGNFLRYTHLDELPQLVNVLKGDLSLIGPRPLLPEYIPFYSDFQNKRHLVKPGITGLAQAEGGNALSWPQRLRLDAFYADRISPALDAYILLLSLQYFVNRRQNRQEHLFSESFIEYSRRKKAIPGIS